MGKKGLTITLITLGISLILFAAIYFFTQPAISDAWDLSNKGTIGTTISGITAPFIGILGALLVYISFLKQVEANEKQFEAIIEQREIEQLDKVKNLNFKLLDGLREDLIRFDEQCRSVNKRFSNWFVFDSKFKKDSKPVTKDDYYILRMIFYLNNEMSTLIRRLSEVEFEYEDEDYLMVSKLLSLYELFLGDRYASLLKKKKDTIKNMEFQKLAISVKALCQNITKLAEKEKAAVVAAIKDNPEGLKLI